MKTFITIITLPIMIWATDTTKIKPSSSRKQPKTESYDQVTQTVGEKEKNQKACANHSDTLKSKCVKSCCKTKSTR